MSPTCSGSSKSFHANYDNISKSIEISFTQGKFILQQEWESNSTVKKPSTSTKQLTCTLFPFEKKAQQVKITTTDDRQQQKYGVQVPLEPQRVPHTSQEQDFQANSFRRKKFHQVP